MFEKAKGVLLDNLIVLMTIVVEAMLGVILLTSPGLSALLFIVLGVILLLAALRSGVRYFLQDAAEAARGGNGALCLAETAAGVFLISRSAWLSGTVIVMSVVLGICLAAAGLIKSQWAVDSVRLSRRAWPFPAIDAAVTLAGGVLVLAAPFTQDALWTFAGVAAVVLAVADAVGLVVVLRSHRAPGRADAESGGAPAVETSPAVEAAREAEPSGVSAAMSASTANGVAPAAPADRAATAGALGAPVTPAPTEAPSSYRASAAPTVPMPSGMPAATEKAPAPAAPTAPVTPAAGLGGEGGNAAVSEGAGRGADGPAGASPNARIPGGSAR